MPAVAEGETDGEIEVVIEIPRGSRNKYEFDREGRAIHLDRRLFSATFYPADDGFMPDTWAKTVTPSTPWSWSRTRPSPGATWRPNRFRGSG